MKSTYSCLKVGAPGTVGHRIYITKDKTPISTFHDIPLHYDKTLLNMVVEIPRWSNAKLEICREEFLNPIKQDIKDGKPRYVRNVFPYKGYMWNYGALPQTWENPDLVHPETKARGDNDPLDVCEIGQEVAYPGQIKQVKVLGIMCLLDGGETDWKVIAIDAKDPLAEKLNDIDNVERYQPGLLDATKEWFRLYKVPDGKPTNKLALNGEFKNKSYALNIVDECAKAWNLLITKALPDHGISIANVTVKDSPGQITSSQSQSIPIHEDLTPVDVDSSVDKWFFIGSGYT